jgi:hypothetical protein
MKPNAETPDFLNYKTIYQSLTCHHPFLILKKNFFFIFLDNLAKKNVARNSIKDKDFNF